ncbi:MAG: CopD family protein [Rhodospirillales bacterium]|nr:CopD family protein [Rhodospirillales bacterium]
MEIFSSVAIAVHALSAIIWIGGMFFAYLILGPSLSMLSPPDKIHAWSEIFPRFFQWVWMAVIALPATGYAMVFIDFGNFASAGIHIHIMQALGLIMIALFIFLYFIPYKAFLRAVGAQEWALAAKNLGTMRRIVGTNLILGLITSAIAETGRIWA